MQTGIDLEWSNCLLDLDQLIERYPSTLWHGLVALEQNVFSNSVKYYSLETCFKGSIIKIALENMFEKI